MTCIPEQLKFGVRYRLSVENCGIEALTHVFRRVYKGTFPIKDYLFSNISGYTDAKYEEDFRSAQSKKLLEEVNPDINSFDISLLYALLK